MDFAYCTAALNFPVTLIGLVIIHDWTFYCLVRLQTAEISKTIVNFQRHISKPSAINGAEREIIVDNLAKELVEEWFLAK